MTLKKFLSTLRFYFRLLGKGTFPLPHSITPVYTPSFYETYLLTNTGWYHDFTSLGVTTPQVGGIYRSNQEQKQPHLFSLIDRAVQSLEGKSKKGLDLFCADGFFSAFALQCGAEHMDGIDNDANALRQARLIHKLLGHSDSANFFEADIETFDFASYDFGICAGGLYHISDPEDLLRRLRSSIRGPLVIQSVYSLARVERSYFETPAPHLTWGCRFSLDYLHAMVQEAGWKIEEAFHHELTANERREDRGSAYLLCS